MKLRKMFERSKPDDKPPSPDSMRLELMGQKLPAEKIGEIITKAAARIQEDETIAPEVAGYTVEYFDAFRGRLSEQTQQVGQHALIGIIIPMLTAGHDMKIAHGDPRYGDFIHDQTGLVDGANATEARIAAEHAMGQVFHDMIHPPQRPNL